MPALVFLYIPRRAALRTAGGIFLEPTMDYQAEIKKRLSLILLTVLDLLTSKKFLVAMGTAIGTYQATGDPMIFLYAGITYVAGQAVTDFGKGKAQVDAATVATIKSEAK